MPDSSNCTGSAAQLVPAIADQTKTLTQFMRVSCLQCIGWILLTVQTPHHIMPSQNYDISQTWRVTFRCVPGLLYLLRIFMFLYMESGLLLFGKGKAESVSKKGSADLSANHVRNTAPGRSECRFCRCSG